jgi:hypothetical protein
MIETVAYAIVCFIICKTCTLRDRLIKAGKGAILFIALFFAYNTLHPLLPEEIDHLLYTTIWGVLFAYAVPTDKACQLDNKKDKDHNEKDGVEKETKKNEDPPISEFN